MKYTLQNLLAELEQQLIEDNDSDRLKQFLTDKITKLVTEAVGNPDELPDREMTNQVKETREWMNIGRNQLRQQVLSVIKID